MQGFMHIFRGLFPKSANVAGSKMASQSLQGPKYPPQTPIPFSQKAGFLIKKKPTLRLTFLL